METRVTAQVMPGPDVFIQADADQLEQLLINLIRNAADASLETGGGVRVGWERQDGRLTVWVRDEGHGLPNTANLFVPFFTTKPPGEGTGLGLSLSHDIVVKQHAGSIEVDTRPGEFTEFRIVLPRAAITGR